VLGTAFPARKSVIAATNSTLACRIQNSSVSHEATRSSEMFVGTDFTNPTRYSGSPPKKYRASARYFSVTSGKLSQVFHQRIARLGIHIYRCGVLRVINPHLQGDAVFERGRHFFGEREPHKVNR
jgi:hypothetical protein